MRWFAAIPLALLPLAAGAAAPAAPADLTFPSREMTPSVPDRCDPHRNVRRADTPGTVGARRLVDLPPGNLDLAVMRSLDGCPEPVTVAENFGTVEGPRPVQRRIERPARPRPRLLHR